MFANLINVFVLNKILFDIRIWNVYTYNLFLNIWYWRNNIPYNIEYLNNIMFTLLYFFIIL